MTLPQEIRDRLKVVSRSKISFINDKDGQVRLFPLNVSVKQLSAILHLPGMKKVTLEEMDMAISEGANDCT
ncbi:MAG TPA: AbrB family transcriptional regulator [Cyanobacteria bacterium UBA8803]|nr:AbrB family transcriptional regulator [Cyanobacteria bacterium UBA9273]HBL61284.1 AbrB family transcriptional regulator [Cyanobacteria bacterium UBA8803]